MSYSPGGFRGGHSPSQKDDRWFSGPENSGGTREDNWRERAQQQQQHWRRSSQAEGPKEDREQGAHKPGEHFEIYGGSLNVDSCAMISVAHCKTWLYSIIHDT